MAIYPDKKDGKLTGRFRVEVQLNGARRRGRFDAIEEARQKEKEWQGELARGETAGSTVRVDERGAPKTLLQLLRKASPMLWNGSDHGKDAERKVEIIARLCGDERLDRLSTTYVDDVVTQLRSHGKAPGTINRHLSALHRVLEWGHARGRAYVREMPEFSWETEEEGRIRWLTCEEEREMIDTLTRLGRPDVAAFVKVAIDTGCRRGELLNTPLMDLDGDWLRLWGDRTKTKVSRSVPLTPEAKALLKAHLPWQLTEPQLRYWWDVAKEKIGLGQDDLFVLHACRHTCATRLVEAGVNLRVVQEFMGHASIKTTERYAHVSPDTLAQAAAKLTARKPQLRKVG